mmetsp:Transcript_28355/g.33586  ORF Transcript_28355/g.33586 Transcript_28355/m.33586 type:complete len:115 (+) Transcript_28355:104-448(+)
MTGKDKTAKAGKSKKAQGAEFAAALAAAEQGDSFTCSASNTAKGGSKYTVGKVKQSSESTNTGGPMYDNMGNFINPPEEKRASGSVAPASRKQLREAKKAAKRVAGAAAQEQGT